MDSLLPGFIDSFRGPCLRQAGRPSGIDSQQREGVKKFLRSGGVPTAALEFQVLSSRRVAVATRYSVPIPFFHSIRTNGTMNQ